ncbi:MAG TPA: Rieske 2Fe-2S domain-containing protein, partial [Dongiaceae bacterium]
MAGDQPAPSGPDLAEGIALADLPDGGKLVGHLGEDQILLLRRGGEVFAISASCTHYSGPLAEGLVVGDMIRCPWHHAGFDIRSGEALRAPALSPLGCWAVEQRSGKVFIRGKRSFAPAAIEAVGKAPDRIVIIGGGAAGFAAAERLRRARYQGSIVMLSDDSAAPVDRPNLSKDYLAGNAPEEWVPLRPDDWYKENGIELRLGAKATGI